MAGRRQKQVLQWDCKNGKAASSDFGPLLIKDFLLEEVQPTFNTNCLTESETWEGHTDLERQGRDTECDMNNKVGFFWGGGFTSGALHLQMRKL